MSRKIYIVQGSRGEYSDHVEWLVKSFFSRAKARDMVQKCGAEHRRILVEWKAAAGNEYLDWHNLKAYDIKPHAYDDQWETDYSGTNYNVIECELEEE